MVDIAARTDRLDAYLDERGLEAVWFARPNGFAWLTGGDNVVDGDATTGVAAAGYDGGGLRVITDDIEADRLAAEELPDAFAVESFPWYADSLAGAVADRSPAPAAADFDVPGFETVDGSRLRQPLTDDDVERYRELGREAAAAVETVCRNLEPEDPEYEVAAGIDISLASRDVDTPVVLVGGAERAGTYRHFTPTDASLGDYALVSVTAERAGLYASLTRTVAFDAPDWFEERHRAAARVEATALRATEAAAAGALAGGSGGDDRDAPDTAGDVFEAVQAAYDAVGFPDEWEQHHQGGAAGFAGREWIATPDGDEPVRRPMGYAWNPTVRGTKSEDTHLVASDLTERLTKTGRWPTHEAEPVDVAGIDAEPVELSAPVIR
ncbi:M24 family metallopeptidase [Halorubrum sp. 2020YC2]|uniref:M24 family metallopeptidase n=1 Tax=Halorubrum sp. 2020YC2 TaxID=2836432 RepID=UPI001BE91BE3|nr:M24 family metallopeptidase [Halorubrum sp. 2020YC2]QWC18323.1 M24 family metallopeptidase [Halorubrum sp. 2020YC2]